MAAERDARILIVDDEPQVLRMLSRLLGSAGYDCTTATSAHEVRELLAHREFELLLADVNMPVESGLELVEDVLREHPGTAAVMVTGVDDPEVANVALRFGAYGYVIKPFTPNEVLIAVANGLRRRALEIESAAHRHALRNLVRARTEALERSAQQLSLNREEAVQRLSRVMEYRDEETGGHTDRMSRYAALLAHRLGLDPESIRLASPMHDVGKVAIPDSILLKPGPLTPDERLAMERHTEIGHEILSGSSSALLELAATIALTHHERYDGTGYPRGLAGAAIPIEGQLTAVADVFDALTSDRPYRDAFGLDQAMRIMREGRGRHFAPHLVDVFLESVDEMMAIRRSPMAAAATNGRIATAAG